MKKGLRMVAGLLSAALLILSIGCQPLVPDGDTSPITVDVADKTPVPEAQDDPLSGLIGEPAPTATPDPGAESAFEALDLEIFRWYATQDGYAFHQLTTDPAAFGIDRSMVTMTLGEFTEEASDKTALEAAAYLERLSEIPRAHLTADGQTAYDIIEQYLEGAVESAQYDYFYEPLTEYGGLQGNLPLMFALFDIESIEDANDYLQLFADVPRYLGQVLSYEQQRAELGMFMTEKALDAVLDDCKTIVDSRSNSFLYATFNEAIDALDGVDEGTASALKLRNAELIKKDYIGAYRALYDGLGALRGKCRKAEGAYAQGKQAVAYYAMQFQDESNNELSIEESLEMLQDETQYLLMEYFDLLEANPHLMDDAGTKITTGSTESDLALLRQVTEAILPPLPEHSLEVSDVPEELEDMMSPAAYVIPSLDGWQHNKVLINTASESSTPLFTLAHETYPGHLYQYVYQRGLENLGLMQRALHYGAYAEAWSQLGERQFLLNQTKYSKDYCYALFCNNMVVNVLMPCMVSIWVNYQGYTLDAVKLKIEAMSLFSQEQSARLAEAFFDLSVDQPYYTVYYGMGYSQLMQMLRAAENDLGDAFDQKAYLTAYLDLGPGYFNIIQERMDVWVSERILESLA